MSDVPSQSPRFVGVVAMAKNRAIGLRQRIPWRLAEDMKLFKRLTMGHPILMGRRTWESMPKRPLPGRQNIILTRREDYEAPGAAVVHSLDELRRLPLEHEEVMVIGGAEIYALLLPEMDSLHVSEVEGEFEADTYFPPFEQLFPVRRELETYEGFTYVLRQKEGS